MTVERGRGYSPATDRSGKLPIGELPVDAIYTPVKRVNYPWVPLVWAKARLMTG